MKRTTGKTTLSKTELQKNFNCMELCNSFNTIQLNCGSQCFTSVVKGQFGLPSLLQMAEKDFLEY
jgi:hypothetical protein